MPICRASQFRHGMNCWHSKSDALVFIRQNINQNLSAADVYAAVGKSHTIVDRAFMKALGTSVKQTIIRFQLEEA